MDSGLRNSIIDDRLPVEIKSALAKPVPGKSLYSFIDKYHPESGFVFNDQLAEKMKIGGTRLRFLRHFDDLQG